MLEKAINALEMAESLGDETAKKQLPWARDLLKQDGYAEKAIDNKAYREAMSYLKKLMEACPNSVRHVCMLLNAMVADNPNDLTDPIQYSTKVQNTFIEAPDFLFWRGRVLIYNGQLDMGKKHIKQALNMDPDCARF